MKLLVAFKLIPDFDKLQTEDIVIREEVQVDLHFLPNLLNCYDESALELALRLRDGFAEQGGTLELTAFTAGGQQAELTLQTLKALGYLHTVRAPAEEEVLRFAPLLVARTLATFLAEFPQDLVLLGREAPVGNSAMVPALVSELAGIPLVANVVDLLSLEEGAVRVRLAAGQHIYEEKIALPCVLSVGNAVISKLRVPTLKDRLRHKGACVETFPLMQPAEPTEGPTLVRLSLPNRRRQGYVSPSKGETALEDVLHTSLAERLGSL